MVLRRAVFAQAAVPASRTGDIGQYHAFDYFDIGCRVSRVLMILYMRLPDEHYDISAR